MAEGEEPQEQEESRGRRALLSPQLLLCRECDHVLHKVGPSADHHARTIRSLHSSTATPVLSVG